MLLLEEVNATHLWLIAAHYILFLSFEEELSFSIKCHDIYRTDKECEYVAGISGLRLDAGWWPCYAAGHKGTISHGHFKESP